MSAYKIKKQLEIAKRIIEKGNCIGISCGGLFNNKGIECPLNGVKFDCESFLGVLAAEEYIKAHQKIRNKDLLKRIERLEEKAEKEKSLFSRPTKYFKEGSRFLNNLDEKEYILSKGVYGNKKIWSLVCLESGLTWNGLHTSQKELLEGTLFTEIIK